jgi:hypothetical protein
MGSRLWRRLRKEGEEVKEVKESEYIDLASRSTARLFAGVGKGLLDYLGKCFGSPT